MTGTSTLEVYDADILVAETGMIVCSMQVIKGDVREAILHKKMWTFLIFSAVQGGCLWLLLPGKRRGAWQHGSLWPGLHHHGLPANSHLTYSHQVGICHVMSLKLTPDGNWKGNGPPMDQRQHPLFQRRRQPGGHMVAARDDHHAWQWSSPW